MYVLVLFQNWKAQCVIGLQQLRWNWLFWGQDEPKDCTMLQSVKLSSPPLQFTPRLAILTGKVTMAELQKAWPCAHEQSLNWGSIQLHKPACRKSSLYSSSCNYMRDIHSPCCYPGPVSKLATCHVQWLCVILQLGTSTTDPSPLSTQVHLYHSRVGSSTSSQSQCPFSWACRSQLTPSSGAIVCNYCTKSCVHEVEGKIK